MNKPVLIYDGDCNFCRYWIIRWKRLTAGAVEYAASQEAASHFPQVPAGDFQDSVILVDTDGHVFRGAEAVFRALAQVPGKGAGLWLYENIPGFRFLSELLYTFIARHRPFFSRLTLFLWGSDPAPSTYSVSMPLFRRLMALVYLFAFASLGIQITGLIGVDGIFPVKLFLNHVASQAGPQRFWFVPTVFWFAASDAALRGVCIAGVLSSVLLLAGFFPVLLFALNWLLYLSLVSVGGDFLRFQWDALLLEAGFLCVFFCAPHSARAFSRGGAGCRARRFPRAVPLAFVPADVFIRHGQNIKRRRFLEPFGGALLSL